MRTRLAYAKKAEQEGKERRKELFKRMLEETKGKKAKEIKDLEEAKAQLENMEDDNDAKYRMKKKVNYLEDDLEKEFHKTLLEKGEAIPQRPVPALDDKINDDFKKALKEVEERNAEIDRRAKEDAALAIAQER